MVGELQLCHERPRRAAACAHKGKLFGHFFHEILCLLHGTKIGAQSHLFHAREAQALESLTKLTHVALTAELPHEGRRHASDDFLPRHD